MGGGGIARDGGGAVPISRSPPQPPHRPPLPPFRLLPGPNLHIYCWVSRIDRNQTALEEATLGLKETQALPRRRGRIGSHRNYSPPDSVQDQTYGPHFQTTTSSEEE
ncbi:Hypothetical predicted protein [Prunus dulcis]|uniref:Uncharacterized protein n=1 Tax=Prunus dulcis TaxID=3755 RepID=A0A5E4E8N5_PRUDU|nr:Hypothetical predicted protein [Prunus dulcis]